MRPLRPLLLTLVLALLAPAESARGAAPAPAPADRTTHFTLHIVGAVTLPISGQVERLDSDALEQYAWTVKGSHRTLSSDLTHVQLTVNGKTTTNLTMSAHRLAEAGPDGKVKELDLEHAPVRLKALLAQAFDSPLLDFEVDANGRELPGTRKVLGAGAGKAMQSSLLNGVLMHPPYFPDKKQWQAPAKVSAGPDTATEGTLTYTRIADEAGLPTFEVEGTLTHDAPAQPRGPITQRNLKHIVKGKQSYDPALGEWVVGTWSVTASFDMFENEKKAATAKGTMKVEFKRTDPKGK
jgi:hypothetical protein